MSKHLIGIAGSLRQHSFNRAILQTLAEQLGEAATLEIISLADIPLYNEDSDGDASPAAVRTLRDKVQAADGVILGVPEYNYGMSGVMKNTLDWLSRPHGQAAMSGKPVLYFTSSPAFTGGVRAQEHLLSTLTGMSAKVHPGPQLVFGVVHEKIQDGRLRDPNSLNFLQQAAQAFIDSL